MTRRTLIDALRRALAASDDVRAAWLGGSDASGRTDAFSDVDLVVVARDDAVEGTFGLIEAALRGLAPIDARYRLPSPTWHGHEQAFYRLEGAGPHLLLDLVVQKLSAGDRLLERERHGDPVVLVDRDALAAAVPLDRAAHGKRVRARHADLRGRFDLFQTFVTKAIERGQAVDAAHFYRGLTLAPLVELLRIRHCPDRFDYGFRYLDRDVPPDVRHAIQRLSYAADLETLRAHQIEAAEMFARCAEAMPDG